MLEYFIIKKYLICYFSQNNFCEKNTILIALSSGFNFI